jgi:hypothetical protein
MIEFTLEISNWNFGNQLTRYKKVIKLCKKALQVPRFEVL